jgi:trans-aconitate 2-methyltransferase
MITLFHRPKTRSSRVIFLLEELEAPFVRRRPILEAHEYYSLLRSQVSSLDLWFTEYVQALTGDNPVAEFAKGSFVGSWLSALSADEARDFELDYRQRIASAYPACSDGATLFPFRRFFLLAQR